MRIINSFHLIANRLFAVGYQVTITTPLEFFLCTLYLYSKTTYRLANSHPPMMFELVNHYHGSTGHRFLFLVDFSRMLVVGFWGQRTKLTTHNQ